MIHEIRDNLKENVNSVYGTLKRKQNGKLPRLKALYSMAVEFINDMNNDNVGLYAAQAAFFTMLSAIPFIMIVILCIKYFIHIDVFAIITPVINAFPEPVGEYMRSIIEDVFYRSETVTLLSVTVITMLWSSSRGTMAIYSGMNNIYGCGDKRRWIVSRIISFFYNILLVAAIVATVIVLVFGNAIISFIDSEFIFAHYVLAVVFKMKFWIFFVLFVLAFGALYTFLPRRKLKYKKQLVGAITTAAGWIGFSYVFSVYVTHYSKYSFLYGSLAAIVVLMLWMYFCEYMLLIGAEVNKHIESGFFRRLCINVFYRKK